MPPSSYPSRSGPPPPADPRGPHVGRTGIHNQHYV
jgi:hypothetical protein